jgi:hypothetical protein
MWSFKSESERNTQLRQENYLLKQKLEIAELALEIEKIKVKRMREHPSSGQGPTPSSWSGDWGNWGSTTADPAMKMTEPKIVQTSSDVKALMDSVDKMYKRLNRKRDG